MKISELLSVSQQDEIRKIGIKEYESGKKECCGFVLTNDKISQQLNEHKTPQTDFIISSKVYTELEKKPGIKAIFHSHTNGNKKFTQADVELCQRTQKPLIMYDVWLNEFRAINTNGKAPLVGREFCYGIYDCYSLVRDYYMQLMGILLPEYPRASDKPVWDSETWNWINVEYEKAGFVEVKVPQKGDLLAMCIGGKSKGINHLAVYMGEDKFMHQLFDRKSSIEMWGAPWSDYTIKFLRYKELGNSKSIR